MLLSMPAQEVDSETSEPSGVDLPFCDDDDGDDSEIIEEASEEEEVEPEQEEPEGGIIEADEHMRMDDRPLEFFQGVLGYLSFEDLLNVAATGEDFFIFQRMERLMRSRYPEQRLRIVRAIGLLLPRAFAVDQERLVRLLLGLAKDRGVFVRCVTVDVMTRFIKSGRATKGERKQLFEALLTLARDPLCLVRFTAIDTLVGMLLRDQLSMNDVRRIVSTVFTDPEETDYERDKLLGACWALARDENSHYRILSLEAWDILLLEGLGTEVERRQALVVLLELAKDKEIDVRHVVAGYLGDLIACSNVTECEKGYFGGAFLGLVKDGDALVRSGVVESLRDLLVYGNIAGDERAQLLEVLLGFSKDGDAFIRSEVVESLLALLAYSEGGVKEDEQARLMGVLLVFIKDGDDFVQKRAVEVLNQIGQNPPVHPNPSQGAGESPSKRQWMNSGEDGDGGEG